MLWGVKASCVPVEGLRGLPKAAVPAPTPTPPWFPAYTPPPLLINLPGRTVTSARCFPQGLLPPTLASCSKSPEPGTEQPGGPGHRVNIPVLPGGTTHLPAPLTRPQTPVPQRGLGCAPRREQGRMVIQG